VSQPLLPDGMLAALEGQPALTTAKTRNRRRQPWLFSGSGL